MNSKKCEKGIFKASNLGITRRKNKLQALKILNDSPEKR